VRAALSLGLLCFTGLARFVVGQEMTGFDRERDRLMLRAVEKDLRQYYYDTTFRGLDLTTLFDSAEARIKRAQSNSEAFYIIAVTLNSLQDSHTFFVPPQRTADVEYGWSLGTVGDSCYIVKVDLKSDAAAKGVKLGDRVVAVDRFAANRTDRWNLEYVYRQLVPRVAVRLALRSPGDSVRSIVVQGKVVPRPAIMDLTHGDDIWRMIREEENFERTQRSPYVELSTDIVVLQLRAFSVEDREIDRFVRRAQGFKALVLDLRGDLGGDESTLLRLAGALVGADTFGVRHRRHKTEPLSTRADGPRFTGTVVVVVDAQSASAAETLAYLLQMRKRGTIVGDRTAGAVMEAKGYEHRVGTDVVAYYGTLVSVADIVFADGTRLEGRGVIPDEILLPSGADLAAHRDPALARAIALAGRTVSAEEAGSLFPIER
jgi:C-terminal processing protease CtpA/Prc